MLLKKINYPFAETLRLLLLASLVTYVYWPFIAGISMNLGGSDARFYQYIMHDALIQLQHGIFPTYLGQSEFTFYGGPVIRAPYYLLLGQLFYIFSFKHLDALTIQHLTVLFSAFTGAFLTYFLATQLAPKSRWPAVALALFYITCPGVLSLIYRYDMYYSFMTTAYLPLVIYGLIRSQQKNDLLAYLLTALGLSLTWMAHPPIALWTTAVCLVFYSLQCLFLRQGLRGLLVLGLVFLSLNLWQFVSVFSIGVNNGYEPVNLSHHSVSLWKSLSIWYKKWHPSHTYAEYIIDELKRTMPGIFLPVQWPTNNFLPCFQLGYSLWLVVISALVFSLRSFPNFAIRALLCCILFLLLYLYPLPYIAHVIWAYTPMFIHNITDTSPMQRFYIILAAITCFIGALILDRIRLSKNQTTQKILLFSMLIGLSGWNLYQASYFINAFGITGSKSWLDSKNIFFTAGQVAQKLYIGVYDPVLKNQLLNAQKDPIARFDNEQFLLNKCFSSSRVKYFNATLSPSSTNFPSLASLSFSPNERHLLCFNIATPSATSIGLSQYDKYFDILAWPSDKNLALPIFIHSEKEEKISLNFDNVQASAPLKLIKAGLISYKPEDLPIFISSYTPYKASVTTPSNNNYLKMLKRFFPGYTATVNGKTVSVLESKDHLILIPLKTQGLNQVELSYTGFPMMKLAAYVSITAWCLLLGYLFLLFRQAFTGAEQNGNTSSP